MPEKVAPKMITINLYGKRYRVPDNMTMLKALEYCGYAPTRGIGCRHGFCGACAMVYRIKGERQLHYCLGCETRVQDMMYISTISYFPLEKQAYDLNEIEPTADMIKHLYPEIYSCVSCNTCTATCTQGRPAPRSPSTASCVTAVRAVAPPASPTPKWRCSPVASTESISPQRPSTSRNVWKRSKRAPCSTMFAL